MTHKKKFIFVLGPHRSGTSLVAAALHAMGVNLGSRFIDPNEDNPKGFFEDEEVVRFNDRLLRSMNLSWDSFGFIWQEDFSGKQFKPYHRAAVAMVQDRFGDTAIAGLKDPRFCILLPFWKRVLSEAFDVDISYVLGIRDPEASVLSQKARHIKDSDFHMLGRRNVQTLLLWWTYMYRALGQVDPERLVIVDYTSLVQTPDSQCQRLGRFLGLEQSGAEHFSREHVEPLLNRSGNRHKLERRHGPLLWEFADTLYQRLFKLAGQETVDAKDLDDALARLDISRLESFYLQELQYMSGYAYRKSLNLRHRLILTIQQLGDAQGKQIELQSRCDELLAQNQSLREDLNVVVSTRGWKLLTLLRSCIPWPFR
ncbi:MAG: sulfotransferase [Halioglobus sp.]|nr:sulfotransferase [Halioglobus sp.]